MDDISVEASIPLDDDGFLRRQCHGCGREFKIPVEDGEVADLNYCPYCRADDDEHDWHTDEQLEYYQQLLMNALMPELGAELKKMAHDLEKSSGGLLTAKVDVPDEEDAFIRPEGPDMKLATCPQCEAAFKIEQYWLEDVTCISCGDAFSPND